MVGEGAGSFAPFSRDKLFLSLYNSLVHRQDPSREAAELTDTVISKLPTHVRSASIPKHNLKQVVQVALNRFDKVASAHYEASHRRT